MREKIFASLALLFFVSISFSSFADRKIKVNNVLNKYGFDSWVTEKTKCIKVNRSMSRKLTRCVSQGRRTEALRKRRKVTQYKCRFKDKSKAGELLIYQSRRICRRQLNSMFLEGN